MTQGEFNGAVEQGIRLPTHLLPWHKDFVSRFGKEGQGRYDNVVNMMNQYGEAIRIRAAAKQQEKAELQEYVKECKAQWRKARRKEQGKKFRGCRGHGQQRKQSRADRRHAAATGTQSSQQGTAATSAAATTMAADRQQLVNDCSRLTEAA